MPGPVASAARAPSSTTKRSQEHQQRPAKRAKLSQSLVTPHKNSVASIISRKPVTRNTSSNGFKDNVRIRQVDESTATITNGTQSRVVAMTDVAPGVSPGSGIESGDNSESEPEEVAVPSVNGVNSKRVQNGTVATEHSRDANDSSDEEGGKEQPTFGELFEASTSLENPIDVSAALDNTTVEQPVTTQQKTLSVPSGTTLSTVLTQALRTHDKDLLETCLQLNDLDAVRATIERLPSPLALNLLHRLGERLHKRPGRAATLIVWIQWTLVAHGGQLVAQKGLTTKLAGLHRVISERAQGLQPLLQLKGKLDMLSAQLELRHGMGGPPEVGADDEEAIVYVEGEDSDSDAEKSRSAAARVQGNVVRLRVSKQSERAFVDDDGDDGMGMPAATDSENEQYGSDEEGIIDEEAEETDRDTGDDLSETASTEDEDGDEDENGFIDDGESAASSGEERPRIKRSTAPQRPSRKAF